MEQANVDKLNEVLGCKLSILHQNIRSVRKNFDTFMAELSAYGNKPDIIVLSEVWINEDESNMFQITNYKLLANFNNTYRAGGIMVFINTMLNICEFKQIEINTADSLMIIFKAYNVCFSLVAIYRLNSSSKEAFLSDLRNYLYETMDVKNMINQIYIGDINIDLLDGKNITDDYKTLMSSFGFESMINEGTRLTDKTVTCIDHIFIRLQNRAIFQLKTVLEQLEITDHAITGLGLSWEDFGQIRTQVEYRSRLDYDKIRQKLGNYNWESVYCHSDPSKAYDEFCSVLSNVVVSCTVNCFKKPMKKLKPWINDNLCNRIRERNQLHKQLKKTPLNNGLKRKYKILRNKLNKDIRETKINYYRDIFENCKHNSKDTWRKINELTGQRESKLSSIMLQGEDGNIISEPYEVANKFNKYFISVVDNMREEIGDSDKIINFNVQKYFIDKQEPSSMFLDPVCPGEVTDAIKSLKNGKAPGLDGFSSQLVKNIASCVCHPFSHIINLSFLTGIFPEKIKKSVVIPIHKKGSTKLCNQYRPITLVSVWSKIIEKIMKKKLISFLNKINFFSEKQYGFRTGRSTEGAIVQLVSLVSDGINNGKCVSGLFLDICKAFDSVDHDILLIILMKTGIRGLAHKWFCSYLSNRKQFVRVGDTLSEEGLVKYGIPQGSVLGAILFIIYINGLSQGRFRGRLSSFADDTALCYVENTWEDVRVAMVEDLAALKWWFIVHKMQLNVEKTNYVNFSLRGDIIFQNPIRYKCINCLNDNTECENCKVVQNVDCVKYLGIKIDKNLTWKIHISMLRNKLNNVLRIFYFLRRMCTETVLRTVYFSLVQSRMEYAISVWGGTYKTNLMPIFILQKRFVRMIKNKPRFEHTIPLFKELKIMPLKNLYIFKVMKIFFLNSGNRIESNRVDGIRAKLRNANNMGVPKPNTTFFTKTYNFIAPKIYNEIPDEIKILSSNRIVIRKLRKWLLCLEEVDFLLNILQ